MKWNPFAEETDETRSDGGEVRGRQSGARTDEYERLRARNAELESEVERLEADNAASERRIDDLERKLEDARSERAALEEDVEHLSSVVAANADGTLETTPREANADATERLYRAYETLLEDWRETIDRTSSFSEQVSSVSAHVDDRIESVKGASREVSEAVDDISAGSETQNSRMQEMSEEMRNLSATIEEIAASANEVAEVTRDASERGSAAQASATDAMAELDRLEDHAERTVENVERLDALLEEIEDVVELITDVADETNMLALNANIEAARTDASGDGFAVVANEVKDLAAQTKDATAEIEQSIERVDEQATDTVAEMHETRETVGETADAVEEAIDELERVVDAVEDVNTSVQEIDDATDTQATSTQEVVSMVDEVTEITDETANRASVAAEAATAQTTELAEVSTRVATLTERAGRLESTLESFDQSRASPAAASNETVVEFWHAMGGENALLLEELAREFEAQSTDVSIELSSKGSYRGTLDATLTAAEDGNPPAIAQIFEIGSKRARDSRQFRPVEELLSRGHLESLIDQVTNYYRVDGTLHSLPFNSSNPVLIYNENLFREAGLDPDDPPQTLGAVRDCAEQLVSRTGVESGITFANYSWFVEQWFAEADETLVDNENGRAGPPTASNLDGEFAHDLFEWWTGIEVDGLYHDPGIENRGAAKQYFYEGRAAMLIDSTSSLGGIESTTTFDVGTGPFPVLDARTGVLVGGASLWVGQDLPEDVTEAVGEFLTWLTEPEQQMRWHRETGYFPVHEDAVAKLRSDGWFAENPHYRTAFDQLRDTTDTVATRGAQIGPFDTVRTVIEEAVDDMDTVDDVSGSLEALDSQVCYRLEATEPDDSAR